MLFHINLFSATFLDLQFQEWYLVISIYQVNTLFKVRILKPMYRKYISRYTTLFDYLDINQMYKITTKKCESSIINEFNKQTWILSEVNFGSHHKS